VACEASDAVPMLMPWVDFHQHKAVLDYRVSTSSFQCVGLIYSQSCCQVVLPPCMLPFWHKKVTLSSLILDFGLQPNNVK
jgi:hypothetical protein